MRVALVFKLVGQEVLLSVVERGLIVVAGDETCRNGIIVAFNEQLCGSLVFCGRQMFDMLGGLLVGVTGVGCGVEMSVPMPG